MNTLRHLAVAISLAIPSIAGMNLAAAATETNAASAYPERPITIIVPRPPSGFNDSLARIVGVKLQEAWKQSVIIDNRDGAATTIGTNAAAKAAPDGYTLLVIAFQFVANPSLHAKLPYDTLKDFEPVILAGETANILVVRSDSPVQSLGDLIGAAKAEPGKLNYASAGNGSSNHLSMELLKSMAGVDMLQIPYKGSGPMVTDLLGGQVDVMFDNAPNVLPHIASGKMRALATTGTARSELTPQIPTVAEAGLPGYEVSVFYGLVAPAGTPAAIIEKLNAQISGILEMPDVRAAFKNQGVQAVGSTPDEFKRHLATQIEKWSAITKQAGIKND